MVVTDPAGIKDLAEWWGLSVTDARAVTVQDGFPAADRRGKWQVADVDAWLEERGRVIDPRLTMLDEEELDLRRWNVPWEALAWWQKPIQFVYVTIRGGGLVIAVMLVLVAAILVAAAALVYLYLTLTG